MKTPPIAYAVMGNNLALVKKRLQMGCDINELTDKGTALHVACIYGRHEIGRFLLENGANPRAKDKFGQMPIDIADDEQMVALLREFGVTEFGIHDLEKMKQEGQRNAFLLGNKNSLEDMAERLDPVDFYYGFYAPWISLAHLNALEKIVGVKETIAEEAAMEGASGSSRLYGLDSSLLSATQIDDPQLFELSLELSKSRPFKKLPNWDKYSVFIFLAKLRALNFVAKKRKLKLFFQLWVKKG
mgnify:CR=1 FL=1